MKLEEFIQNYDLEKVKIIEQEKDRQYTALKNSWDKIIPNIPSDKLEKYKANFLYMIIQTAIISYQLSGKGEDWWTELAGAIANDWEVLENNNNLGWWDKFINNCKNNKRLISMKLGRLKKLDAYKNQFDELHKCDFFYSDMGKLNRVMAKIMNQDTTSKTIVFSVKMFGYGARFVLNKFIPYPFDVQIPVDSRIEKIYMEKIGKSNYTKQEVMDYFEGLARQFNIPPLHLDGLLWIEYWYNGK